MVAIHAHAATSAEAQATSTGTGTSSQSRFCTIYHDAPAWKGAELLHNVISPLFKNMNCPQASDSTSTTDQAATQPIPTIYSKVKNIGSSLMASAKSTLNDVFIGFLDRQWERLRPSKTLEK